MAGGVGDFGQMGNSMMNQQRLAGASMQQENASTNQQVATIGTQIQADAMKQAAQRRQIMQETATKINEMRRETTLNRAKSANKLHNKWVQQVMS